MDHSLDTLSKSVQTARSKSRLLSEKGHELDKEKLANNYFIPCNLIIAGIIFMLLLCSKEISSKTVFISMLLLTWQSFVQFFLLMFRITDTPTISIILISLAFLLNLNGSISTFVLFAKKFRRKKSEKFCWWE